MAKGDGSAVNLGNRPMSPHLQIYKPQLHSAMSIFHRASGVVNSVAALIIAWWFVAAASGPDYFNFVNGFLSSWVGSLMLFGFAFSLAYHLCNGIRHLFWDAGYGFEKATVRSTGIMVMIAAGIVGLGLILISALS